MYCNQDLFGGLIICILSFIHIRDLKTFKNCRLIEKAEQSSWKKMFIAYMSVNWEFTYKKNFMSYNIFKKSLNRVFNISFLNILLVLNVHKFCTCITLMYLISIIRAMQKASFGNQKSRLKFTNFISTSTLLSMAHHLWYKYSKTTHQNLSADYWLLQTGYMYQMLLFFELCKVPHLTNLFLKKSYFFLYKNWYIFFANDTKGGDTIYS